MVEQAKALNGASYRLITAARHQPIFHEGDASDAVYRLDRGCVRLQIESEEGQREVVTFLFPGDIFCAGYKVHWASAYAVTDSVLAVFSMSSVWDSVAQNSGNAMALLKSSDDLLDDVAHHLALSHANASARLRWFLRWLAARIGRDVAGDIPMPMSRRDIADFLGIAPETVSRMFARLERRGEVRRPSGRRSVRFDTSIRKSPPNGAGYGGL